MKLLFVIPGDIEQPTGGYRYDRQIIDHLQDLSFACRILSLPGQYPFPREADRKTALNLVAGQEGQDVAVVDGLAGGVLPELLEILSKTSPVVALIHHPLFLETGLSEEQQLRLKSLEKTGLSHASLVITTSRETARQVESVFDFDGTRIKAVLPGVECPGMSTGSGEDTVNLLCVASVIERKDHITLLRALSMLTDLDWRLDCVGKTDFDPELFSGLGKFVSENNLQDRIRFHGELENRDLEEFYRKADIFVLPSRHEGYGMAFAEAIVRGIPVLGTTAGAIPDTVPDSCGILVEPGNVGALAAALKSLLEDKDLRQQLRNGTLLAAPGFPDWRNTAARFAQCLEELT